MTDKDENVAPQQRPSLVDVITSLPSFGLSLFYTLFAAAFAFAFGVWWPVLAFWGLTLNRLLRILLGQPAGGQERTAMQNFWGLSAVAYIIVAGVTTLLPVPAFGITQEVVARQGFSGGGLWEVEPQRVIAFGFLYFGLIGLYEMYSFLWNPRFSLRRQE